MRTIVTAIALLPCGGTYTMIAAEAASTFKPKVVIPITWGNIVDSSSDPVELKKSFKGETIIKVKE